MEEKVATDDMSFIVAHLLLNISSSTTKQTKWSVRPAKTQVSLGLRYFLSYQSLRCTLDR